MLALSLAFLSLMSVADAAPVVLHAESDAEAVRLDVLSSATSLDGDLAVTHFDAFRSSLAPALLGGVGLKPCSQEVSDPLSELLKQAEGSLSYLELEKAGATLQSARDQLLCISTPADPKQAATRIRAPAARRPRARAATAASAAAAAARASFPSGLASRYKATRRPP